MIDELEALSRFRSETPAPSDTARLRARRLLDTAIAADQGRPRRSLRRPMIWRLAIGATAGAAAVALVVAGAFGGQSSGLPRGLRNAILAAYDGHATDILHVRQTRDSSNGPGDVTQIWSSLTVQQAAQRVATRQLTTGANGAPLQDFSMSFTLPTHNDRPYTAVGDVTDVDYASRTWSHQSDGTPPPPPGLTPDVIAVGSLRTQIANGRWSDLGPATVDGERTIELVQHDPPGGNELTVWVDAQTYIAVQEQFAYRGGSVTSTLEYLPATPANQAELSVTVPAGFTQTGASPQPQAH